MRLFQKLKKAIDMPHTVIAVSIHENIRERIEAGATILNVSGGKTLREIVKKIKDEFPDFPVIATGGPNEETIRKTIEVRTNAITDTTTANGRY